MFCSSSSIDMLSDFVTLYTYKNARKPADALYPYGYGECIFLWHLSCQSWGYGSKPINLCGHLVFNRQVRDSGISGGIYTSHWRGNWYWVAFIWTDDECITSYRGKWNSFSCCCHCRWPHQFPISGTRSAGTCFYLRTPSPWPNAECKCCLVCSSQHHYKRMALSCQ